MVLPMLVKKEQPETAHSMGDKAHNRQNNVHLEDESGTGQKKRRRRKKKMSHLDVQLIAEKSTYICNKCDRKFNREASLKWHLQFEHNEDEDKDDDDDNGDDGVPDYSDDAQDENYVDKSLVTVKRPKTDDDYGSRPFTCDVCSMKFKELPVLKAHMLTHSNVRQYRCTYEGCPYAFKTKGSLTRHIRRHTGERPYSCEACGRKFAESGALTRHMRARNPCISKTDADLPRYGKKWSYVPNIPAVVGSGDGVTDEFLPVVPGDTVTLVQEGEDGEQIITQAQIISSSEDVGAFEMEMEEGEIKESEVEDTTADFENLALTQCRVCKEECVELEALRIHLRTHLADLNFRCSLCHFVAETREELQTHLQSKHLSQIKGIDANSLLPSHGTSVENSRHDITPKNEREAQIAVKQLLELAQDTGPDIQVHESLSVRAICRCPVCNRAFRGASYMRQHMKSHTGDRPHICSICPKSFTTKDALNKHLVVHTDDRNFKCGVCGKLFKRIGHVKEHLKIHNSDRPFACTFCDKAFKTHNALKVHVRTHSDVFPYECRICHRHFREKGSLQRHCRMHTGERPFHCSSLWPWICRTWHT
ncbi:transcription factor E4F1-like isoform X2 [Pomacea canaliculata]|nr:transcription factor E4F1-like isoform X2 [Pomacea canaliculata]